MPSPPSISKLPLSLFAACLVIVVASTAQADKFHMQGGNVIEGQVLEDKGDRFVVRVAIGTIEIEKKEILERIPGLTPWERYETRKAEYPDTADGQFRLAVWCRKNNLRDKELIHLRRVIVLDPEHERARLALGHEKVNGKWVDPRARDENGKKTRSPDEQAARDAERAELKLQKEQEKLVQQLLARWNLRVKGIFRGGLEGKNPDPTSKKFIDARDRILAMQDPLAIPAIASVLSTGAVEARKVMVASLGNFPQDEATMNLVVVSLLDPAPAVRLLAADALKPRKDDRVSKMLRDALKSDEEFVLRNAAVVLGVLRDHSAVRELVNVLQGSTFADVPITRPVFLQDASEAFLRPGFVNTVGGRVWYSPDRRVGVWSDPRSVVGSQTTYERQLIAVPRTEVQEALIAISGQNFGFDADAWLKWHAAQRKAADVKKPATRPANYGEVKQSP